MFSKLIRGASPPVYCLSSQTERCVHSLPASFIKKNSWNRAVSDAEKLVGYPTSLMSVRALMDDDFANIAVHMRKLIGSEHPVLHTVKRLVYQAVLSRIVKIRPNAKYIQVLKMCQIPKYQIYSVLEKNFK